MKKKHRAAPLEMTVLPSEQKKGSSLRHLRRKTGVACEAPFGFASRLRVNRQDGTMNRAATKARFEAPFEAQGKPFVPQGRQGEPC